MKKEHYYFDMSEETYKYIIKKGILKESKKKNNIRFMFKRRTFKNYNE